MSPFEMLKILGNLLPGAVGEIAGLLLFTVGILLWVFIPFYDPNSKNGRKARNAHYFGIVAVFPLLFTTTLGYWTIQ